MRSDITLLRSIIEYCDDIQSTIDEMGKDVEDFLESRTYQHACGFCIEQIGRNVKDLSEELTKKYNEVPWKNIAGMRDIISHRYRSIILERVWATITEYVPTLKEICKQILYELENP